jgi:cytochrome d ubiquinol oxidase subunit II
MSSVAPFWDGNQTWLVLGGGGLFVAFPKAYGVLMSAAYLPVIVMLLALVFRGVSFEYREVAKPKHHFWDRAFSWGSKVAAFMQGVILGTLVQGISSENGVFTGGPFDWLTPFSIFTGFATMAGYALLGACWLNMKTVGRVAEKSRDHARMLLLVVLAAMVVVSLWTPFATPRIYERWFTMPNLLYLSPVPILTALAFVLCWLGIEGRRHALPFFAAVALFLLGLVGLAISSWPYMVPPSLTIREAAAHPSSQMFMLVGTAVLLPFILGYTAFVYRTFRGKVKPGEGYH